MQYYTKPNKLIPKYHQNIPHCIALYYFNIMRYEPIFYTILHWIYRIVPTARCNIYTAPFRGEVYLYIPNYRVIFSLIYFNFKPLSLPTLCRIWCRPIDRWGRVTFYDRY